MSSSPFYNKLIQKVYIEEELIHSPLLEKIVNHSNLIREIPFTTVKNRQEIPEQNLNRNSLFICRSRGDTVSRCPGTKGHLCCNYITVDLYVGCPLGCSYCIMKSFLKTSPITVYLNTEPAVSRIEELVRLNKDRVLRIGTGEVGDSLLFDPIFKLHEHFIKAFASHKNVYFELKTKTHFVDHLLELEPKGNTVIGFSLNPQILISKYEGFSSSLKQRVSAALRAVESGYLVSFHFDPIILIDQWEKEYKDLISSLNVIPDKSIAWISLGTMRYSSELKEKLICKDFLLEEFVPCRDGKFRYLQKIRSEVYRVIYKELSRLFSAPIYLCMESAAVWRNVFGKIPREISKLSGIFKLAKGL